MPCFKVTQVTQVTPAETGLLDILRRLLDCKICTHHSINRFPCMVFVPIKMECMEILSTQFPNVRRLSPLMAQVRFSPL